MKGDIIPGAKWEIINESPTTTVVDGHWGFGYVANERAMQLTIEKAGKQNVAAATVFRQGHIGRLATYPLMAAKEGMIAMITADSGRGPKHVAPFGGRKTPLVLIRYQLRCHQILMVLFLLIWHLRQFAGKINLALARGNNIPEGWIIDKEGRATTDPADSRQEGLCCPWVAQRVTKAMASLMIEIFSGILTGLGHGVEPTDGIMMGVSAVFKRSFRPLDILKEKWRIC